MANKVYQDDVGTIIIINCGEDISVAASVSILVKKPDNTEDTWDAEVYGTNYLKYTTVSGDLDQAGKYTLHPYISDLSGWTGKGNMVSFSVNKKYS